MRKVQRGGAEARGQQSNPFQLGHRIAPDTNLEHERNVLHVTASYRADHPIERSGAAPEVMRLARGSVYTERY